MNEPDVDVGVSWGPGLHTAGAAMVDAEAYFRYVGRWSAQFVAATLAAAKMRPGWRVLDVATGPGVAMEHAASLVGAHGAVIGSDISTGMLATAAARVEMIACSQYLVAGDAQALPFAAGYFDAVICQLGLMFVPDAAHGLREFHRVLRPGGRAAICVISTAASTPMWSALAQALSTALPLQAETLTLSFSLADATRLASLFSAAGFGDLQVRREWRTAILSSIDAYWDLIEAGAGPPMRR